MKKTVENAQVLFSLRKLLFIEIVVIADANVRAIHQLKTKP